MKKKGEIPTALQGALKLEGSPPVSFQRFLVRC
jgi:hypothetical protein